MTHEKKDDQTPSDGDNQADAPEQSQRDIQQTTAFKKGFKHMKSRGTDLELLKPILSSLVVGEELDEKYRDHQLDGKWKNSRDCHILPDWVLIYRLTDDVLILEATGSHSDVFRM
jgi:mRNA interferase YafQ